MIINVKNDRNNVLIEYENIGTVESRTAENARRLADFMPDELACDLQIAASIVESYR